MFKKDHFGLGLLIGIIAPLIFFGILYLVSSMLTGGSYMADVLSIKNILLISIFINLIPIRYYFVSLKMDLTGRGLVLITFILVIFYFLYFRFF